MALNFQQLGMLAKLKSAFSTFQQEHPKFMPFIHYYYPFFKLYNIYYITFIWRSQNGIYHRYFAENEKGLRIMVRYEYNEYRVIGV